MSRRPRVVRPKRRSLLTWADGGDVPPEGSDLAALQQRYGPPQPRDPQPGQTPLPLPPTRPPRRPVKVLRA